MLLPGYGDTSAAFTAHLAVIDPAQEWVVAVAEPHRVGPDGPLWYTVDEDGPDPQGVAETAVAVAAAIAVVAETAAIDPAEVVLAGHSQGGAAALATCLDPAAGRRPRAVAALRSTCPTVMTASTPRGRWASQRCSSTASTTGSWTRSEAVEPPGRSSGGERRSSGRTSPGSPPRAGPPHPVGPSVVPARRRRRWVALIPGQRSAHGRGKRCPGRQRSRRTSASSSSWGDWPRLLTAHAVAQSS